MSHAGSANPTAVVVGGGPAGLMAAEVLSSAGIAVTVYEQKASVGRKFLLAGRGGLNLTHSEPLEKFLERYGASRDRLAPSISAFTPDDLRAWCAGLGQPTFVGSSGRVFPESFRATPLLRAWTTRLASAGVRFEHGARWLGWGQSPGGELLPGRLRFQEQPWGQSPRRGQSPGQSAVEFHADGDVVFFGLGGASWPRTGSDGGWVDAFADAGVSVAPLGPANCGVAIDWSDVFIERFDGLPLKNCSVTVNGAGVRGDPIVTRRGLEGAPIYAHSASIRHNLDTAGTTSLTIDLEPDLGVDQLIDRLEARRRRKDSVSTWLKRAGFAAVEVGLLREFTRNKLPRDAVEMAHLAKAVPVAVNELMPIDRAISSSGGVPFDEVDDAYMLRRMPGVFVAGEMLDWEAPTGGYLLQATFSTAVAAARGALAWVESSR